MIKLSYKFYYNVIIYRNKEIQVMDEIHVLTTKKTKCHFKMQSEIVQLYKMLPKM